MCQIAINWFVCFLGWEKYPIICNLSNHFSEEEPGGIRTCKNFLQIFWTLLLKQVKLSHKFWSSSVKYSEVHVLLITKKKGDIGDHQKCLWQATKQDVGGN